jgi:hypothetical protein
MNSPGSDPAAETEPVVGSIDEKRVLAPSNAMHWIVASS